MAGMDNSPEFKKVVIEKSAELNIKKMKNDLMETAVILMDKNPRAIVLECTNLISFRSDLQKAFRVPIFDLVTLIDFYISGIILRPFQSRFMR